MNGLCAFEEAGGGSGFVSPILNPLFAARFVGHATFLLSTLKHGS